jgi:hypothetical protein
MKRGVKIKNPENGPLTDKEIIKRHLKIRKRPFGSFYLHWCKHSIMSYLILHPKTKKEEQVFIELAQLLKVHVEKSGKEALADIRERKNEVLTWAKAQDKKMQRGKAKLTNDEIVAIVKENRLHAKK